MIKSNPNLLIWDIDGTLISCKGSGMRAMTKTFESFYGIKNGFENVNMAGRVDYSIIEEACNKHNVKLQEMNEFYNAYAGILEKDLEGNQNVTIFNGIEKILEETSNSEEFVNIIGTGNCEVGAWLKLKRLKLENYFETGGFGTASSNRTAVIKMAIEKARENYKMAFDDLKKIYIIGDTPADIECGRELKVNTVAIATGGFSVECLKKYNPDFIFDSLKETKNFLNIFN